MQRILTGDRPTGRLHIGHYFGSLQDRVALQRDYDSFILIADVQALTDHFHEPRMVRENVLEVAKDNLAAGLDPERVTLVIQSLIPEIAELTILYSNLVSISRLQQNPTVRAEIRQKGQLFKHSVSYGFLGYPVSQAADITAFQAQLVPVGEDQLPMLEQTREIVRKFNRIYGETLIEPKAKLGAFARIKGLDGKAKMSKSLNNAIFLADSSETTQNKVKQAVTDPRKLRLKDPGHPEACTVFSYHQMFTKDTESIASECRAGGRGCVFCKEQLAASINDHLAPLRERRQQLKDKEVHELVMSGTAKARLQARETLHGVKESMALNYQPFKPQPGSDALD